MPDHALNRLIAKSASLPDDERAAYMVLCLAILANHAPEVLHFILDRADERLVKAAHSWAEVRDADRD